MADFELGDEKGSGGALREKLEEFQARNKVLEEKLHGFEVKDVLTAQGLSLVKPEDLAGVPLDKVGEKATALQAERQKLQEQLLRDALARQGYDGDDLEDMVSSLAGDKDGASQEAEGLSRIRSLNRLDAKPVPLVNPEKLHGRDAIAAALEANARKRK